MRIFGSVESPSRRVLCTRLRAKGLGEMIKLGYIALSLIFFLRYNYVCSKHVTLCPALQWR